MSNFLPSPVAEAPATPGARRDIKLAAGALAAALAVAGCTRPETKGLAPTNPDITCLQIVDGAKIRSSPSVPGRDEAKDHNRIFELNLPKGNFVADLQDMTKKGELTVRLDGLYYVEEREDNNGKWYGIPTTYTEPLEKAAKTEVNVPTIWVNEAKVVNCSPKKKR